MSTDLNPLYGLWSVTDRSWVSKTGAALPLLYSDAVIKGRPITGRQQAKIDAIVMTERFMNKKQFEPRIYDGTAKVTTRHNITPDISANQAINRLERKAVAKKKTA